MTYAEPKETAAGIELATGEEPELAIIWLHGLGADGHDFVPIVPELGLPFSARYVFPHAPVRPVTINGGMRMRAWYDILGFDRGVREDEAGILASVAHLHTLIDGEIARGLPAGRIVAAGFSQGGAVALYAGLKYRRPLAGILALSTYLPLVQTLDDDMRSLNVASPIWFGHGTEDPVIPLALAERSRDWLAAAGADVEWHAYPMPHAVSPTELRDIARWLNVVRKRAHGDR